MSATLLQWGRNLFVAECHMAHPRLRQEPKLQWGRNLFVAECPRAAYQASCSCRSFNGAATCSLRNVGDGAVCHPGGGASMGPQLVRCGMPPCPPSNCLSPSKLQWGRNLFVAECPQMPHTASMSLPCFNGAATCSLRNGELPRVRHV